MPAAQNLNITAILESYCIWWLHLGDLFKSERLRQLNLNDL